MTTQNEGTQRDVSIRAYSVLKDAASSLHHWQEAKREQVEISNRAEKEIEHADNCIAHHANLLREALTELGFTHAPEAEVGA